jgi:hypothetical protein
MWPIQGSLVENDHVIEALAANRPNDISRSAEANVRAQPSRNARSASMYYSGKILYGSEDVARAITSHSIRANQISSFRTRGQTTAAKIAPPC